MKTWWSRLPLKNKLQIPIQLLLLMVMVFAQRVALDRFEERVLLDSRQKAVVSADGVLNGLNMLMISGIIGNAEQRALYTKKMGVSDRVLELRNIRSKTLQDTFGSGLPSEQAVDELDRLAMTSAREQSKLTDLKGGQSLRIIQPFVAKRDFGLWRPVACLSRRRCLYLFYQFNPGFLERRTK